MAMSRQPDDETVQRLFQEIRGAFEQHAGEPAAAIRAPFTRAVDPDDRLPRRRNPRIGCEQHASGTWIHGAPHTCPKWTRR